MITKSEFQNEVLELIELFETSKHDLQHKRPIGTPGLNFAGVILTNHEEVNPNEGAFIQKRIVRSDMPQIYTWLFRKFVPILSKLPNYGFLKEEVFGRLGNTIQKAETISPELTANEKVVALFSDFYELGQDLLDGVTLYSPIAINGSVEDDWVTRSIKSGFDDLDTFEKELFGEAK
jgi:hypothetical protein